MPTQLLPHAYAEWEGCLRGSFPRLGAYAGASAGFLAGWPCWMAMFAAMFTVAVLNATLDLAALVLVGVWIWSAVRLPSCGGECWLVWPPSWALKCSWFGQRASKWSRCLRAASAEPTRAYAVEPRQIPRNHLYNKFVCITSCTYSSNYTGTYMRRQASWQFTYSFTS